MRSCLLLNISSLVQGFVDSILYSLSIKVPDKNSRKIVIGQKIIYLNYVGKICRINQFMALSMNNERRNYFFAAMIRSSAILLAATNVAMFSAFAFLKIS